MKIQLLSLMLTAPLLLVSAHAQTKATTAPAQAAAPAAKFSNDGQWEYLVISFGKTYFSSPADINAKKSGQSKLMVFGPLGGVVAQEALDTQSQVDTLGRYGWELIGVLGAIGGDQEWVFKRPFDADRAAREAAQIKKEGADLAAARDKAAKEAANRPVMPSPTELVDLDAREAQAKQAQLDQALRDRVTNALNIAGWSSAKLDASGLTVTTSYDGSQRGDGTATIYLDVTQRALSGSTYRRSTVKALIEEYANALKAQGRFGDIKPGYYCTDSATVQIGASIKFNNDWKEVGYPTTYCVK